MKRNILTLFISLFVMTQAMGQTYSNLWKQATEMHEKDLPKSEMAVMKKIIDKATLTKDYGQLLAAELNRASLSYAISPDSLVPAIKRLEVLAAQTKDPMLQAVWYAALGKLCRVSQVNLSEEGGSDSVYFRKALANPQLLASHLSTEYVPLTCKGMDGATFGNDMLHVIGFEADTKEAYQLMYAYYNKVGNRGAACLCAFELTQKDRMEDVRQVRKSKYLNTIDSFIHVYQDIPEAGELAVEHFRFMEGATDATSLDKLNYINYALNRWGGWSRMNVLRNAQKRLTEPSFYCEGLPTVIRPSQTAWLKVKVRNLQSLKVTLSRLNITADNDYDVDDEETYKLLKTKTNTFHQKDFSKSFYGRPDYEEVKDSFKIANLPLGAYLLEVTSDNVSVKPQRALFYVSDLALMSQQLPDDSHRYVVVSATTGQPIAGAQILLFENQYDGKKGKDKRVVHARLTTNENGEARFKNVDGDILISTRQDSYTPARWTYLSRGRYYERKANQLNVSLFTDRAIYRPGQTIHVTAICSQVEKGLDTKVLPHESLTLVLRDAKWKTITEKQVTTDAYGTASVDFELPQDGLTGMYSVYARKGSGTSRYVRVEEYKRPTFEISFPKVNQKYTWGDTVVVKATAKTYAGVPVQGAKVSYTVTRRNQLWWWSAAQPQQVMKGEGTTREDGTFDVEIPLEAMPASYTGDAAAYMNDFMRKSRFFSFDVKAVVTDLSGESHEGEMSLPLGTRPTALSVDIPQRIEVDSLKQVTFSYRNASGMEISGNVRYRIDQGEWNNAATNTPVVMKDGLTSGVHTLEAICKQDTLQQKFTLFCMNDQRPVEATTHWSYQTARVFPRDGKPVYVQVGSSENGVHIVYSVIAGNKLLDKGAWEIGDSIVTLPFTYKPEYASGVVINYCFVKNGVCYHNNMTIARPLPEKKLNIAWKSFRNRLTPGQKEEWTLNITTPDGKPAQAQLLSVLYDKALDQITKHVWNLSLGLYQTYPNCYWTNNLGFSEIGLTASYPTKYYEEAELSVDRFSSLYFGGIGGFGQSILLESAVRSDALPRRKESKNIRIRGRGAAAPMSAKMETSMSAKMVAQSNQIAFDAEMGSAEDLDAESSPVSPTLDQVQLRENLSETAFFYPAVESDAKGNVRLKFTLPESITTWKFMGLAHDKEMRNGFLMDEVVAKKTVMVQPNLPRFLREGDKAVLVAKVFNTSDKPVNGEARMQIIDPEMGNVVWQKQEKYKVDANGTATLNFDVEGLQEGTYINKVVVSGNGYSDGEQHYLPVLSDKEVVVNTLPITLHEAGKKDFDLHSLFLNKDGKQVKVNKDMKVTVEFTNNPSWLMLQALPSISNPTEEDALSLMAAIYANTLSRHIQKTVNVKANDINDEAGLTSASDTLLAKVNKNVSLLKKLQNKDGSFSWWKGMGGSRYMTTTVAEMMVRLNAIVGKQSSTAGMLSDAIRYLRQQTAREVKEMKKKEAEVAQNHSQNGKKAQPYQATPSEMALHALYIITLDGTKLNAAEQTDKTYLLGRLEKMTAGLTILGKAKAAVILAKNQRPQVAADFLKSIEEYSVYREEMGRYYDTRKAYYSWRNYQIPTEVAAIEAFQILGTNQQVVEEMQRWLLMSKRTQAWKENPANVVDAVYAFMQGNEKNWNRQAENAILQLDGKTLDMPKNSTTLGYVKTEKSGKATQLTIDKKANYTSWGAVYAEFKQPVSEIASTESGIKIVRKVVSVDAAGENGKKTSEIKRGDKVKVVLTLVADCDYDFVKVIDRRAACLEPVNQLSGYQWGLGCYVASHDNATNFYFERLSKGKHVVEMEYYVDRQGEYHAGSCSVQCTYSPEFGGRTEAYQMKVND